MTIHALHVHPRMYKSNGELKRKGNVNNIFLKFIDNITNSTLFGKSNVVHRYLL